MDPEDRILSGVLSDQVKEALDRLSVEFRMVVILADLHEFSYREIAEMMECPIGTVMSRLHRARKLLQQDLLEYASERGIGPAAHVGIDSCR